MYVAINAHTKVGSVRINPKNTRVTSNTKRLVTTLLAASIANGTAIKLPIREPNKDILIVSNKGAQILFR